MKLAFWHFYTFRLYRGIETLTVSLANALAEKGAEVSLVNACPTLTPLVKPSKKLSVYSFPTFRYFSHQTIVPFYIHHFLNNRYDHIIVFFGDFGEGATWRFLNGKRELPLTLYLCYPRSAAPHRYETFRKLGWDKSAERLLADSSWVAKEAENYFNRSVSVLPVGTDVVRFCPNPEARQELRQKYGYGVNDNVLLNVSSLEPRKGVGRVIEALGRLKKEKNLKYFILGKGPDEMLLRKRVSELGLEGRVHFGGESPQLERYYNMADIFIMLSDEEANSVACQEAMSSGLPVIVSDRPGFRENIDPTGACFVDTANIAAIDAAVTRLSKDHEERRLMGSVNRRHVERNFSWDKIAEKLMDLLK